MSQGSEKDKEEVSNRLISVALLSCYQKLSFFQADDILTKYKDFKSIPSKTQEFKDLISLEKWAEVLTSGDSERIQAEMGNLQEAAADLRSDDVSLNSYDGERSEENYSEAQDIHYDRNKNVDLNIFGLNLTELDPFTKNVLGLGLIALVFLSIIYGLNWIRLQRQANVSKKTRKNKKD